MTKAYIMMKGLKTKHTYSSNIKEQLEKEGWKCIATVTGWNMSFNYY